MTWLRTRALATTALFAASTAGAALVVLWPRPTHAEEIPDDERRGEYEEDGIMFGKIVVKGELVAAAKAPGGWALVRTVENKSDQSETVTVEERVLRTETMPEARVNGASVAVIVRNQVITLGPHEKRSLGVSLPPAVGAQMTAGIRAKAQAESVRQRALEAERWDDPNLNRTYMTFDVEYLKPLPPGATAQAPDPNRGGPARMPDFAPLPTAAPAAAQVADVAKVMDLGL